MSSQISIWFIIQNVHIYSCSFHVSDVYNNIIIFKTFSKTFHHAIMKKVTKIRVCRFKNVKVSKGAKVQ